MSDTNIPTVVVEREIGGRIFRVETGEVARLAGGAVMVTYGESVVLTTAVRANPRPGLDFFPLQCDYREKMSAAGKYPGGFRKREGAPSEREILTMRNMDRPIRPLFPDGFIDEVQIQCFVMSHDGENDTDTWPRLNFCVVPDRRAFQGPLGTVRVGRIITDDGDLRDQPHTVPNGILRFGPVGLWSLRRCEHDRSGCG